VDTAIEEFSEMYQITNKATYAYALAKKKIVYSSNFVKLPRIYIIVVPIKVHRNPPALP